MEKVSYSIVPIGSVQKNSDSEYQLVFREEYRAGLHLLESFSHLLVLWWADGCDTPIDRGTLNVQPLERFPDAPRCGVFASRSPARPNPVMVTVVVNKSIDHTMGVITVPFIDANDKTPIIDVKPYLPCSDRVQQVVLPNWLSRLNHDFQAPGIPT